MKILLIGEYSNIHWTLAKALRNMGHRVDVLSHSNLWLNNSDYLYPTGHQSVGEFLKTRSIY